MPDPADAEVLPTTAGDIPLAVCRVQAAGREWAVRYTRAVLSQADESAYLDEPDGRPPYGVMLWPAALALTHEIAVRAAEFRGKTVLELGAGTGLPGLVAAGAGGRVVQTDRNELALAVCRLNGERNGMPGVECRPADWEEWTDTARYDWVIGSDILYGESLHAPLRHIFETNLTPGGRVLLSDPFRHVSLHLLDELEQAGWRVTMSRWTIGEGSAARPVGVFELVPPDAGRPPVPRPEHVEQQHQRPRHAQQQHQPVEPARLGRVRVAGGDERQGRQDEDQPDRRPPPDRQPQHVKGDHVPVRREADERPVGRLDAGLAEAVPAGEQRRRQHPPGLRRQHPRPVDQE